MLSNLSKNGVGIAMFIIALVGLDVPQEAVQGAWEGVVAVISLGLMVWHQWQRVDTKSFFFKK